MKIATWNVNSLRVRLPQVLQWLEQNQPDLLCLQETKMTDPEFPRDEIEKAGYHALFVGQKTYNGVCILSRIPGTDPVFGIPGFADEQKRVIGATYDGVRMICVYVPNGESLASDKYQYKLSWLAALEPWLKSELQRHPKLAIAGDYNIAPEDRDVYDPKAWEGSVLTSAPEREAFNSLIKLGLSDAFRLFEQKERSYSWWDYRMNAFRRNMGLRIDHILLSRELSGSCASCEIDLAPRQAERPSDHTPVVANIPI